MGKQSQPTMNIPSPPSAGASYEEFADIYPRLMELQNQYMLPQLQAQEAAQEAVYPGYKQLRDTLMGQIQSGISDEPPSWYTAKASDYLKDLLGENVRSGVGANFYTTSMLEQNKAWGDYYRNLGMSMAGQQPIYQSNTSLGQSFTPSSVMSMNASTYSPYMNAWSGQQQLGAQANQYNAMLPWMALQGAGNVLSGVGSMAGQGGGFMGWGPR